MPLRLIPGTEYDELWIQRTTGSETGYAREGKMQDARGIVVGLATTDRRRTYPVAIPGLPALEYGLVKSDPKIVLRVRAMSSSSPDTNALGLLASANRDRNLQIGCLRRGVARSFSAMIIEEISEPEDFAGNAVITCRLKPGVGNVSRIGDTLYSTLSGRVFSGTVGNTSTNVYAGRKREEGK